ncbi:DUF4214 domain-containing protein [Massilia sp. RP-1-19]|uniref:DUF4214 domain-containing protein n=1 Tax=Massilia polaris TaxID=2728846 RepID=A0A848HMW5_9BURK|nr:DUF4214 domain-containing protein [Massilia polaris]NML61479.1 DUF4214 domain-containing protein [Massilia polaris]
MKNTLLASLMLLLLGCGDQDAVEKASLVESRSSSKTSQSTLTSVKVDGYRAAYDVTLAGDGVRVVHRASGAATTYGSIEQLEFIDRVTVLSTDGIEAAVYRLYQAAFDRKPDAHGLGFWIDAARKGASLRVIAEGFMASPEFAALYGSGDTQSFLVRVYKNVLHREPDAGGLDWWMGTLAAGTARVDVLVGFSDSGENKLNVSPDFVAGLDFAPYRKLTDHVAVRTNIFGSPPVDTHTQVVVGVKQLGTDSFVLTSAYWDFGRAGADRFRAGPQYLLKWDATRMVDNSAIVAGGIPAMYQAEISGAVGDINHDGTADIILGGNGPDGEGVKSEPSYVLLSKGTAYERLLVPNGALTPDAFPWAHGLTTVQRRGTATRSIYIGDYTYGPSYLVDLGSSGQLAIAANALPAFLGKRTALSWGGSAADMGTTAALGVDLDGDGVEELVVGTLFNWTAEHTNPALNKIHTVIVRQDHNGSFAQAQPLALPNGPFAKRDCYQKTDCSSLTVKQIDAADFNRDGRTDLVVTHHVYGTDVAGRNFTGSYPQILINRGSLSFEDATQAYFGKNMTDLEGGYVHALPFDLNSDGCQDIVLRGDANNRKQPRVFLNNCKGGFVEFTDEFLTLVPKVDGIHEQVFGGIPVTLGGKPAILLWSTGGSYPVTNMHAVQFATKIPTPTGSKVVF